MCLTIKKIIESVYRPFCKQNLYFDNDLNERQGKMPKVFPNGVKTNFLICVSGIGGSKDFSVMIFDKIPCFDALEKVQCFPLYWYKKKSAVMENLFSGGDEYERRDGVSDFILNQARLN